MTAPTYDLVALRAAANKACELAYEKKDDIEGAINWGDFGCYEARRYETDRGETGYSVSIEEASPAASKLMFFIMQELNRSGFENIEVQLEW